MPNEWVEVNIEPTSLDQPEGLLLEVIDPLLHDSFSGRVGIWFFGWYSEPRPYHLRLRIRWHYPEHADDDQAALFAFLDAAQSDDQLASWWPGSHGVRGQTYPGEIAEYRGLWDVTCKDWMSGSELALALVKQEPNNLTGPQRLFYWGRRLHLFSNRLRFSYLDEASLCLQQARGYLPRNSGDPRITRMIGAIDQLFPTSSSD